MRANRRFFATSFVLLACAAGCGEDWRAETVPVTGSLSVNGEPATGAVITLYPQGGEVDERRSKPFAVVGEDGSFQLKTYEANDGAPPGDYVATVKWPWDVTTLSLAATDRLKGTYESPSASDWRVTVGESDTVLEPKNIVQADVETTPPAAGDRSDARPPGPGMGGERPSTNDR